ncbi:fam-g protein [Plasmodium gallinaceum]|uniref:Fam-g protein n=1 Tax=Plasmodium gallinaceum TaxID=5849 RepID=A0A1J1GYE6_PLAGA|nr:fam-g protein [Plasmodium gallinaceum]CRG96032.1 fam-g protein [Plasmodium gallinaceum]
MKTYTLCLKIFTFFILTWIFHCFYDYDSNRSFVDKDILQKKNMLKDKRLLAEGNISEKKQTHIKERNEHYPSGEKDNKDEKPAYFMNIYNMLYSAFFLLIYKLFPKRTNRMSNKFIDHILNVNRKNNSEPYLLPELSLNDLLIECSVTFLEY